MKCKSLSLVAALAVLAGCTGPVIMGGDAAVIAVTRPSSPPPADTQSQIGPHESWCYSTMGDVQCYPHAQDVPPERLINVEPQSSYPLDLQAYHEAVIGRMPATTAPTLLQSAGSMPVEKTTPSSDADPGVKTP